MRYLSLFSGIGAFEKALINLEIPFELVGYSGIDKYASRSYSAIHNIPESLNFGDITKWNSWEMPQGVDLVTYGFPCQDISVAGKQKGFTENGELTRSGLFFMAAEVIKATMPKVAIAENVKALTGKKFAAEFETVLNTLENIGYKNYYKVLNAKDYGIPQNRERVFIISIRKDIDFEFSFPQAVPLELRLKDLLESPDTVDEKYYLTDTQIEQMKTTSFECSKFDHRVTNENEVVGTLCARDYKDPKCVSIQQVAQIYPNSGNPQAGRIYNAEGISPCVDTCGGGTRMPKIAEQARALKVKEITNTPSERFFRQAIETGQENECRHGDTIDAYNKRVNKTGICPTVTTRPEVFKTAILPVVEQLEPQNIRIRKLTPKECWRLMVFSDCDIDKAEAAGISNSQLYKQAGNSIVVDVAEAIIKQLGDRIWNTM